ncbi:MAG: Rieske (2Fe-2S) protein [Acidobacteriales bacterium]|nr:Rieske (2Fe-2S) protein [Terriglobales bacterium]
MGHFVKIAAAADMPPVGEAKEFSVGDHILCVANVNGTLSAMDNACLHVGGPLGQGLVEKGKVVCPWHGWQYDPRSGALAHSPGLCVAVYPIKIENKEVWVEL